MAPLRLRYDLDSTLQFTNADAQGIGEQTSSTFAGGVASFDAPHGVSAHTTRSASLS
jgi:hypothetical protein